MKYPCFFINIFLCSIWFNCVQSCLAGQTKHFQPIVIRSGLNVATWGGQPLPLEAGTLVCLEKSDFLYTKRPGKDLFPQIVYFPAGSKKIVIPPQQILYCDNDSKIAMLYFSLLHQMEPMSVTKDYRLRWVNKYSLKNDDLKIFWNTLDNQNALKSIILSNKDCNASIETVNNQNALLVKFATVNLNSRLWRPVVTFPSVALNSESSEVRVEFKYRIENYLPKPRIANLFRLEWLAEDGTVLGTNEHSISAVPGGWQHFIKSFKPLKNSKCVRLCFGVYSNCQGSLFFRDVLLADGKFPNVPHSSAPAVYPEHRRFSPLVSSGSYIKHCTCSERTIVLEGQWSQSNAIDSLIQDLRILAAQWANVKPEEIKVVYGLFDKGLIVVKSDTPSNMNGRMVIPDEAWSRTVNGEGAIQISSAGKRGLQYAIDTLREELESDRGLEIRCADSPQVSYRFLYHYLFVKDFMRDNFLKDDIKQLIQVAKENRMNGIVFHCATFWQMTDPVIAKKWEEIFSRLREESLIPVPAAFNFRDPILTKPVDDSYDLCAGQIVKDELYTFDNEEIVILPRYDAYVYSSAAVKEDGSAYPIILRTPSSPLEVRLKKDEKLLIEGKDYRVEGGWRYGKNSPFKILRLKTGRIPPNSSVCLTYNYLPKMPEKGWRQICLSEPRAYDIIAENMKIMADKLHPKLIHIGWDEYISINMDMRDVRRGLDDAALVADSINRMVTRIKKIVPNIRIMMWDDMINSNHQRGWVASKYPELAEKVCPLITKDVIISCWSADYLAEHKSIELIGENGFSFMAGGGYKSVENNLKRVSNLEWGKKHGLDVLGVVFTEWRSPDYLSLYETAGPYYHCQKPKRCK